MQGAVNDGQLISEITSIRYKYQSTGKLKVESKDEMKRRGQRSPDVADSFVLTFAHEGATAMGQLSRLEQRRHDKAADRVDCVTDNVVQFPNRDGGELHPRAGRRRDHDDHHIPATQINGLVVSIADIKMELAVYACPAPPHTQRWRMAGPLKTLRLL